MRPRVVFHLFLFCLMAIVFFGPSHAWAQSNRATITGTVTDQSGAVVVGAQVIAKNSDTGVQTKTVSNGRGIYSVLNLPPGTYDISVSKEAFKSVEFSRVTLI